jgi:hypothetical protein
MVRAKKMLTAPELNKILNFIRVLEDSFLLERHFIHIEEYLAPI